jgi:PST family polysaccharide transporter
MRRKTAVAQPFFAEPSRAVARGARAVYPRRVESAASGAGRPGGDDQGDRPATPRSPGPAALAVDGAGPEQARDRNAARRELGRSVGLLGSQRLGMLLLGAARTKVAAWLLGPAGMGFLAQALSLQELMRQAGNLGTSRGFLKLVAEYGRPGDEARLGRLIVTATGLVVAISGVLAVACFALAEPVAARVFGDPAHAILVRLTAITVVAAVPGAVAARVFNGLLDLRAYAILSLAQPGVALVAMAALALAGGVTGAVMSFAVAEIAGATLGAALLWRRVVRPRELDLRPRLPDPPTLRRLLRYAGALTSTSLASAAATLLVRSELLRVGGAEANGLYQVAWQVGQNYLALLAVSLWSYGMPKVASQLDDPHAIVELQNEFLRLALLVLAPGIVLLSITREAWIPLLYSRAFLAAGAIVAWQLAGELLSLLRQSLNISLLPRERLGFLVAQGVGYWVAWAALACALLPGLGVVAVPIAYLAANAVLLAICFAYHQRVLGFRLDPESRLLLATTLPGFAVAMALAQSGDAVTGRAAPLALVGVWAVAHRRFLVRLRGLV